MSERETESDIRVVPSEDSELVLESVFQDCAPAPLLSFWTKSELLVRWWPRQEEIDARLGGRYTFRWPSMHWELYGAITTYSPPTDFDFTWSWRHQPHTPARHVHVHLTDGDGATRLVLRHGTYNEADIEERAGHREGWMHFLSRLHEVSTGDAR